MVSINDYLNQHEQFPYCSGCGHTWINKSLAEALSELAIKPSKVNLISDIGCVGLVDKMFKTNTIHTTHGRSSAFAAGLSLADQILYDGNDTNVIMIGDGGATIGLLHLIEAAKLNLDLTVLLHNNFVYGMTGGQGSGLTPEDFKTATALEGNLSPAINIIEMLKSCQPTILIRKLATDKDLATAIATAIKTPGFALIEIIELCTGYATKWNKMSKTDVQDILERNNTEELGVIYSSQRASFTETYKKATPFKCNYKENIKIINATGSSQSEKSYLEDIEDKNTPEKNSSPDTDKQNNYKLFCEDLEDLELNIIVAGSAGGGVQFAAKNLLEASMQQGMQVMQKNDNPVTIGTGFSLSEIKISNNEILYSAIDKPDYVIISSVEGYHRIRSDLEKLDETTTIIIETKTAADITDLNTQAKVQEFNTTVYSKSKRDTNIVLLAYLHKLIPELSLDYFIKQLESSGKSIDTSLLKKL